MYQVQLLAPVEVQGLVLHSGYRWVLAQGVHSSYLVLIAHLFPVLLGHLLRDHKVLLVDLVFHFPPCGKHHSWENYTTASTLDTLVLILYTSSCGDLCAEVRPDPIPNSVVKLCSGDDTARETSWDNTSLPH